MTLKQLIKGHRQEIDACLKKAAPDLHINDFDRINWLNKVAPEHNCWQDVDCNKICETWKDLKYKKVPNEPFLLEEIVRKHVVKEGKNVRQEPQDDPFK